MTLSNAALPSLTALLAAVAFGVSGVTSKRGLAHVEPLTGSLIAVGSCLGLYLLSAPLWIGSGGWFSAGFWLFALIGIFQPSLSNYLANQAYRRAGATIVSTFSGTTPLFAALFAIAFLGERLTLVIAAGTVLTVFGLVALSWMPRGAGRLVAAALLFATATAAIRGLNHAVAKVGIDLLPNVLMAGFISFAVSFVVLGAVYRVSRGRWPRNVPRAGVVYFVLTGVSIGAGIGFLFAALSIGTVVVVSPITATYPVFTLLLAAALRDERITGKVVAGVVLVVAGVMLISGAAG